MGINWAVSFFVVAAAFSPSRAQACGGCISPPGIVTTVDSHRMAIAVGLEKTILWDQIRYSGDPEDFVWILPIPPTTVDIDIADAAFLDELDSGTAPIVQRPPEPQSVAERTGCAGSAAIEEFVGNGGDVVIYSESVVGPYETVVVGSDDQTALYSWIDDNGYAIDEPIRETLDYYVDLGYRFIILRLAPEQGIEAMEPVRVTFPGVMTTFPLKMVTVGAVGKLGLSLWVFAEQRYEAGNYANVRVNERELRFPETAETSNYGDVFANAIDSAGGRAWVTEYAGGPPFFPFALEEARLVFDLIEFPVVTRLRTDTLVDYLDEDLKLVPADNADVVPRFLQARDDADVALATLAGDDGGCTASSLRRQQPLILVFLCAMLALGRVRRRKNVSVGTSRQYLR